MLKSFATRARYNVLTPALLLSLGLGAAPAFATPADAALTLSIEGQDYNNTVARTGHHAFGIFSIVDLGNLQNSSIVTGVQTGVYVHGDVTSLTNTGTITGGTGTEDFSGDGVNVTGTVGTFNNSGQIYGGSSGESGGDGVDLGAVGTFTNSGVIGGGAGGTGYSDIFYGDGGDGVYLGGGDGALAVTSFVNTSSGSITGGDGGVLDGPGTVEGGYGGDGVDIWSNNVAPIAITTFSNAGTIAGGAGGQGGTDADIVDGGSGGDGVYIYSDNTVAGGVTIGSFSNSGLIAGGDGGAGGHSGDSAYAGSGGDGVYISAYSDDVTVGSFTNSGTISGGGGGAGGYDAGAARGGSGGAGVKIYGDVTTFTNNGLVQGGNGGAGGHGEYLDYGGAGGDGVYIDGDVGSFANTGTILGGAGGAGGTGAYAFSEGSAYFGSSEAASGGSGVRLYGPVGSFSNSGLIAGGDGGAGQSVSGGTGYEGSEGVVNGGFGGLGVAIYSTADNFGFTNTGSIHGGNGGAGGDVSFDTTHLGDGTISGDAFYANFGGGGGFGVLIDDDVATFSNSGEIIGGNGGDGGTLTVAAGGGLDPENAVFAFGGGLGVIGSIDSVSGGSSELFYLAHGGDGVAIGDPENALIDPENAVTVGTFTNSGVIRGGDGGDAGDIVITAAASPGGGTTHVGGFEIGGTGGDGVHIYGTVNTFSNTGMISGGNGGAGGQIGTSEAPGSGLADGGYGGSGVSLIDVGSFANSGSITGGKGGAGGTAYIPSDSTGYLEDFPPAAGGFGGTGVYASGTVGSFNNTGTITGGAGGDGGLGVFGLENGGDYGGDGGAAVGFEESVGSFSNGGLLTGGAGGKGGASSEGGYGGDGVYFDGGFDTFNNTGTIIGGLGGMGGAESSGGAGGAGVGIYGDAGTFANSGLIVGGEGGRGGVGLDGNGGSGGTGVYIDGSLTSFTNTGVIRGGAFGIPGGGSSGDSGDGVLIESQVNSFTNSGEISGYYGVEVASVVGGDVSVTNAGVMAGTSGTALLFANEEGNDQDGNATLNLLHGANFDGVVDFANEGDATIDFSGYRGSMIVDYRDQHPTMLSGDNLYIDNEDSEELTIIGDGTQRYAAQSFSDIVGGISDLLSGPIVDLDNGVTEQSLNYMAKPSTPAEAAVDSAAAPVVDTTHHVWAQGIGGGSVLQNTDDVRDFYAGLLAGADMEVQNGMKLGALVGYARTDLNIEGDGQRVTGNLGIVGVYGHVDTSAGSLDFQVLGGGAQDHSERDVQSGGNNYMASADFTGWFVAPQATATLPVIKSAKNTVNVVGQVGYVGGIMTGYTETSTDPIPVLTVGGQTIGVFTAYAGLSDEFKIASTGAGDVVLKASLGAFSTTNVGGSDVDINVLSTDLTSKAPTGTTYGAKAGLNVAVPVNASSKINLGAASSYRNDGQFAGSATVKLTGSY